MQQTNLLPENASQNNAIFRQKVKSRYRTYQTTSQCLSSYGCTIIILYILYRMISVQQTNCLPKNASQNDAIFPIKKRSKVDIAYTYQTTSQCLSSYGCAIIVLYTVIQCNTIGARGCAPYKPTYVTYNMEAIPYSCCADAALSEACMQHVHYTH